MLPTKLRTPPSRGGSTSPWATLLPRSHSYNALSRAQVAAATCGPAPVPWNLSPAFDLA
jgi:hypothetical protein